MIASLRGIVTSKVGDAVIVEVAGVGYEVFVPAEDSGSLMVGKEASLMIHEHLREDIHALYGFQKAESRSFFQMLIGINGIGPKVALAIMSAASLPQLQKAIATGDPELLRGVAGVGTKTAQRVMLELRGKVEPGAGDGTDPTYQALLALGYSSAQAATAVSNLPDDVTGDQERIKLALKGLSK
jgi:Holliday junction DNA helicase RuvA